MARTDYKLWRSSW